MTKIHEAAAAGTAIDLSELLNWFANDIISNAVSGKFFREEGRNKHSGSSLTRTRTS
jgi:hypothetical protein